MPVGSLLRTATSIPGRVIRTVRPSTFAASKHTLMIEIADAHMRKGQADKALVAYQDAWSQIAGKLDAVQQVWLLLSIANSAIRAGDFEEALGALSVLPEHYSKSDVVVGNPLFHLLVGLSYHGLKEDPGAETDNFARALICGGPEMFLHEDTKHLRKIKTILEPPAERGTWDGYSGCSRDLLNGATGYLRELLTERIGAPPPYQSLDGRTKQCTRVAKSGV